MHRMDHPSSERLSCNTAGAAGNMSDASSKTHENQLMTAAAALICKGLPVMKQAF